MQGSLIRSFTDRATQTFAQRCEALGLVAYRTRSGGGVDCLTTRRAQTADWLNRPELKHPIEQLLNAEDAAQTEVEPGVWLIPVADPHAQGQGLGALAFSGERTGDRDPASRVPAELCGLQHYTPEQLCNLAATLGWAIADLRRVDQGDFALEDLTEQLSQSYENITLLYRLGRSMSSLEAPQMIASSVCSQLLETQSFGWVAAHFRDESSSVPDLAGQTLIAGEVGCDSERFGRTVDELIQDWQNDSWSKLLQPGEHELADLVGGEIILDPIHHDGRVIGAVLAGGKTGIDAEATSNDTQLIDAIAAYLGAFHENAARFNEQQMMFIGTLEAVSTALDAKDPYTYGHSDRVAHLAVQLSRAVGLEEQEVERIRIAGLVHDVGKIGVPESVLCKTGKLTDEEYDQIKRHPRIGYNILKGIPKMEDVLDGVLYHHERWDGRGYPDRIAGENIPLYGRILAVADTFDAMSSTRSYRQAMPREQVLEEILRCAGSQFDPRLTGPFVGLDFTKFDELVSHHEGLASRAA